MTRPHSYLMENLEETIRLEIKTDPEAVRKQALWCGLRPGLRVLDAACGTGKVSEILHQMIQPDGEILGLDFSEERVKYAKRHRGHISGLDFQVHDLREPLDDFGQFDLIWVRFMLEYYRTESLDILRNLTACLQPGGSLCLLDLDHNCLNHYELPPRIENMLFELAALVEDKYNFDPYAGRKLYAYLYDMGYEQIQVDLMPHHLIYGQVSNIDVYNWIKKAEVASVKAKEILEKYPGGSAAFFSEFIQFFNNPRRFTYTPLILCKGIKPLSTRAKEEG